MTDGPVTISLCLDQLAPEAFAGLTREQLRVLYNAVQCALRAAPRPARPTEVKCADCPAMIPVKRGKVPRKRCDECRRKKALAYALDYYRNKHPRQAKPKPAAAKVSAPRPAPAPRTLPPKPAHRPATRIAPRPEPLTLDDLPPSKFAAARLPVPWAVDPRKIGPAPLTEERHDEAERRVGGMMALDVGDGRAERMRRLDEGEP